MEPGDAAGDLRRPAAAPDLAAPLDVHGPVQRLGARRGLVAGFAGRKNAGGGRGALADEFSVGESATRCALPPAAHPRGAGRRCRRPGERKEGGSRLAWLPLSRDTGVVDFKLPRSGSGPCRPNPSFVRVARDPTRAARPRCFGRRFLRFAGEKGISRQKPARACAVLTDCRTLTDA
jgi:hypothetical protein